MGQHSRSGAELALEGPGRRGRNALRVLALIAAIPVLLVMAVRPADAAARPGGKVVAAVRVTPAGGGEAWNPALRVALYIPAHTVTSIGRATIVQRAPHVYDFHIDVPWHGEVAILLPGRTTVAHRVGDVWFREVRQSDRWIWVDHLSWFSNKLSALAGKLCLTVTPSVLVRCLAEKLVGTISKDTAKWIADRFGSTCWGQMVAAGVGAGPASIFLAAVNGACVEHAGETYHVPTTTTTPDLTSTTNPTGQTTVSQPVNQPVQQVAPAAPSITLTRGYSYGCSNCYTFAVQVHNFPLGTYRYECHDNSGPGGSDTTFYSNSVSVTDPSQSTWPGRFCWDNAPYTGYVVMDSIASNSVGF